MPVVTTPPARNVSTPDAGHHEDHRDLKGGAARAAVFGASDGLLTNVSLILGVAGAHPAAGIVRLAGLAGLLAGAFSMAAGEYISMTAQAELIGRELEAERVALAEHPEIEKMELVAIYEERGIRREVAEEVAATLMRDPEVALETHSREELGVAPDQLGSPRAAALSSFFSFALGALIPLLPWFFATGATAIVSSIVLGAVAAFAIGWTLGHFTERSRWLTALRQLGIAALVASITYGVGSLFGVRTG